MQMPTEMPKLRPDKLAGDQAGSDLGPGAPEPHEDQGALDEQFQSPLSVAGMSPAGGPVDENPAADPGGAP
jgi:hypothetical protein